MKVPSISIKIESDFKYYWKDLTDSIKQNIEHQEKRDGQQDYFKILYPIFTLLESLKNYEYYVDPSTQILLNHHLENKDIDSALKVARTMNITKEENKITKKGAMQLQFTPYFDELYSELLILLNSFYLSNYRSGYILLRCILEDLYRHLYYKDHIQEYWAMSHNYDEISLGIKPSILREYLPKTSFLSMLSKINKNFERIDSKGSNIFHWNEELYGKTSAFVHASKKEHMSLFKSNSEIKPDDTSINRIKENTTDVITLSLVFLICAHREHYVKINDYEKSIILSNFPKDIKYNLRRELNI